MGHAGAVTSPEQTSPEQTRPDRYAARRRLPRWVTVLLVLLTVLLLAVLAAFGLFVWAFSGGWDGLRGQAEPSDREVVSARHHARDELSALTSDVLRSVPGTELARVRFDQCQHGQNNWKIHDGYTLRCELADSVALAPSSDDVSAVAAQVDAALRAAGWTPVGSLDELSQPATPDHSYLRSERTGTYTQGPAGRLELRVGVSRRALTPVTGDLPYDPSVKVEGDLDAYRRAAGSPYGGAADPSATREPRVVVHPSVRYFEDD